MTKEIPTMVPVLLAALFIGSTRTLVHGWTVGPRLTTMTSRYQQQQQQQQQSTSKTTTLFHDIMDDYRDDYIDDDYIDDEYGDGFDYSGISSGSNDNDEDTTSLDDDDDDMETMSTKSSSSSLPERQEQRQVRAQIVGVSVAAESGFWVMLRLPNHRYEDNDDNNNNRSNSMVWPIHVTDTPMQDRTAASSGQALTLVQLLSSVDMAGVILPPTILAQLVTVALENAVDDDDDNEQSKLELTEWQESLLESVQSQMKDLYGSGTSKQEDDDDEDEDYSYADASIWIRSRVRLPVCTLDQVHFDLSSASSLPRIDLDVAVRDDDIQSSAGHSRCTLPNVLTEEAVASVLHEEYTPYVSRNFLALALALRYKAPIVVTLPTTGTTNENDAGDKAAQQPIDFYHSEQDLKAAFPLYTTVQNLQKSSNRVEQNIERSFEIHQLQAAFKIARQKQDFKAMAKIQEKLDELDAAAMKELPVQPDSDTDCMQ